MESQAKSSASKTNLWHFFYLKKFKKALKIFFDTEIYCLEFQSKLSAQENETNILNEVDGKLTGPCH
ncbi:hypothetical protein BpHYR1_000327 [Brachionus plicatilis]|uniref:Uncharacterized protein n=1 Tax=Brachionus plicatilis TaxID=10195 RepID=A0A3M7PIR8_BRAPC|nr:hypothetical protein BpHYR1_000327 [Brachionus plicatilis]